MRNNDSRDHQKYYKGFINLGNYVNVMGGFWVADQLIQRPQNRKVCRTNENA